MPTTFLRGWLWRFAIWITLLTPIAILTAHAYRWLIGKVIALGFTWAGYPLELVQVAVGMPNDGLIFSNRVSWIQAAFYSPIDVGFFAAMCLATYSVDGRTRAKAMGKGALMLVGVQLLLLSCCLASMLLDAADGGLSFQTQLTWTRIMGTAPWAGPIAAWVLWLGRWQLRPLSPPLPTVVASARRSRDSAIRVARPNGRAPL